MSDKRVIEIDGVKLEIDLRQAKKVENFKVGDTVKLLKKEYDSYKVHTGIIVGFDEFKTTPTIIIAYLEVGYNTAEIKFAYLNKESKGLEIATINEWDIPYSKQDVLDKLDRSIEKKEEELREAKSKKEVFLKLFGQYFEEFAGRIKSSDVEIDNSDNPF